MAVINVIKASGGLEPFSEDKVMASLVRAGADWDVARDIVDRVKPHLYQNMPTFELYAQVMKLLKQKQRQLAERYDLKRAIMELGPTGYPFEKFVGEVLREEGYTVKLNQTVMGKWVTHEIDVVASKEGEMYMVECKFHNQNGIKTDIKEALYVYARFLDVSKRGFTKPWLITNTKLSQDVKTYAAGMEMKVTAWDYPEGESLRELVDKSGLHPVTSLSKLSLLQKQELIDQGMIFCRDMKKCETEANRRLNSNESVAGY